MSIYRQSDPQKVLVKLLSQIQSWIIERLAYKSFNQLDNTKQVDLWPFVTSSVLVNHSEQPLEDLQRLLSFDTVAALQICGLHKRSYEVTWDEDVKVSNRAVFFRHLVYHIPRWLANTTLLGRYAITGERYATALLFTSRYILRLPRDQLAAIMTDDLPKCCYSTTFAWRTFCSCMKHLPQSMEMYFFVLYMYSVMVDQGCQARSDHGNGMARSAKAYLQLVSTRRTFILVMYY